MILESLAELKRLTGVWTESDVLRDRSSRVTTLLVTRSSAMFASVRLRLHPRLPPRPTYDTPILSTLQ